MTLNNFDFIKLDIQNNIKVEKNIIYSECGYKVVCDLKLFPYKIFTHYHESKFQDDYYISSGYDVPSEAYVETTYDLEFPELTKESTYRRKIFVLDKNTNIWESFPFDDCHGKFRTPTENKIKQSLIDCIAYNLVKNHPFFKNYKNGSKIHTLEVLFNPDFYSKLSILYDELYDKIDSNDLEYNILKYKFKTRYKILKGKEYTYSQFYNDLNKNEELNNIRVLNRKLENYRSYIKDFTDYVKEDKIINFRGFSNAYEKLLLIKEYFKEMNKDLNNLFNDFPEFKRDLDLSIVTDIRCKKKGLD